MKPTFARLTLALILILLATARPIPAGLAWDFGGIDRSGLFMCAASGHMDGTTWVQDWTNPIAPLFPNLVVDC